MSFSQIADIADLVAAAGVIASLIFVAIQLMKSTRESKLANWENVIDRFNTLWGRTSDNSNLAVVIAKGRKGFYDLSESEQIIFGCYHEELMITYESMTVTGAHPDAPTQQMRDLAEKHLSYHFSFLGAREWWQEWKRRAGPPPNTVQFYDGIIKTCAEKNE